MNRIVLLLLLLIFLLVLVLLLVLDRKAQTEYEYEKEYEYEQEYEQENEKEKDTSTSGCKMPVFIALYRGINVVGKNSVKMEALRAIHERLGHRQVRSYIQSGNVLFVAKGKLSTVAQQTAAEFAKEFGFSSKILLLDAKQLRAIVAGNPYGSFAAERPNSVHVGICQGKPNGDGLAALFTKARTSESFEIAEAVVYLHAPDGFGRSKFAAGMERACGVPMTVRNWRTIETLAKMAAELDDLA